MGIANVHSWTEMSPTPISSHSSFFRFTKYWCLVKTGVLGLFKAISNFCICLWIIVQKKNSYPTYMQAWVPLPVLWMKMVAGNRYNCIPWNHLACYGRSGFHGFSSQHWDQVHWPFKILKQIPVNRDHMLLSVTLFHFSQNNLPFNHVFHNQKFYSSFILKNTKVEWDVLD